MQYRHQSEEISPASLLPCASVISNGVFTLKCSHVRKASYNPFLATVTEFQTCRSKGKELSRHCYSKISNLFVNI